MYVREEVKTENIYKVVGLNIKKFRKLRNYTAQELAEMCNLSYGFIKNLESKKVLATISLETLEIVAKKLGIKIADLVDRSSINF